MKPMELAVPNLRIFFVISMNAFQAAAQKFLPVIAIYKKCLSLILTYLYISIFRNELYKPFKTIK
jgi:hypothetical protein